MGILVECRCGQEFETAVENAGRRVSCPVCRQMLVIPRRFEVEQKPTAPIEPAPPWSEPLANVPVFSGNAIASFVLGLFSLLCFALTGVPALLFGWLGLRDVRAGCGRVRGVGLSLAGIVFGLIGTTLTGFVVLPYVDAWRATATDQECSRRLKEIGQAMLKYHDQFDRFPRAAIVDKQRRPLLSCASRFFLLWVRKAKPSTRSSTLMNRGIARTTCRSLNRLRGSTSAPAIVARSPG